MSGTKHDSEKPRLNLLDPEWLTGVAKVLTYGANKYDDYDWARGLEWSRLFSAAQRHLLAWQAGEDLDRESGHHHLLHASCNMMLLYCHYLYRIGKDDRFDPEHLRAKALGKD